MSTIRVVNLQHTDATVPNIVLESDGTSVFASGITISGATTLTVSGTAEFASGTAAAPKLTFIDDNDTGIYSPAANNLGITTNGTAALTIDASQRVGIGTTSPGAALDVRARDLHLGATSGGAGLITFRRNSGVQSGYFGWDAGSDVVMRWGNDSGSGRLAFNTNGSEKARIDENGRLLVGTSSNIGSALLAVRGNTFSGADGGVLALASIYTASIGGAGANAGQIKFTDSAGGEFGKIACQADGINASGDYPGRLVFSTTADGASTPTERMRIDSSGNVGIGTTSPAQLLHLTSTGSNTFLQFSDAGSGGSAAQVRIGSNGNDLVVLNNTGSNTATERMRINSSGNVGIGESSPSNMLVIRKDSAATSSGQYPVIDLRNDNASGYNHIRFMEGSTENASILSSNADNDLRFRTNGAIERMRILSGGGITFNGDTAQANALDDYEEGTWSPTYSGLTGTTQRAYYIKVGRLVSIYLYFTATSRLASGFSFTLPFTADTTSSTGATYGVEHVGAIMMNNVTPPSNTLHATPYAWNTNAQVYYTQNNNTGWNKADGDEIGDSNIVTLHYVAAA